MTKKLLFISFILFSFQSFSSDLIMAFIKKCEKLINTGVGRNQTNQVSEIPDPIYFSTDLIEAIKKGNLQECEKLINSGVDRNETDPFCNHRRTPLGMAIYLGHLDIARLLLKSGAEVDNATDSRTPIFCAIEEKNLEMVKLLLAHGSNVNNGGYIYLAVRYKQLQIVKLLLDYGADVDELSLFGDETPLNEAINEKQVEIAKLLLVNGADIFKLSYFRKKKREEILNPYHYDIMKIFAFSGSNSILKFVNKYDSLKSLALSKNIQLPNIQRIDEINDLVSLSIKEDFSENYEYNKFPNEIWLLIFSNLHHRKYYLRLILVSKQFYQVLTTPDLKKHFVSYVSLDKKIRYLIKHNIKDIPLAITEEDVEKFTKDNELEF